MSLMISLISPLSRPLAWLHTSGGTNTGVGVSPGRPIGGGYRPQAPFITLTADSGGGLRQGQSPPPILPRSHCPRALPQGQPARERGKAA